MASNKKASDGRLEHHDIKQKRHQSHIMIAETDFEAPNQRTFAACHQVLATTELLEEILAHLPTKDLLFAQGICRTWKNCIDNSQRLQRGLFFQIPESDSETDLTKILLSKPWSFLMPDDPDVANIRKTVINPLLWDAFESEHLARWYTFNYHPETSICPPALTDAVFHPEASWRRMHLCYPKLKKVDVHSSLPNYFAKSYFEQVLPLVDMNAVWNFWTTFFEVGVLALLKLPKDIVIPVHYTPNWGRYFMPKIFETLRGEVSEMISWVHECDTTAELEEYLAKMA